MENSLTLEQAVYAMLHRIPVSFKEAEDVQDYGIECQIIGVDMGGELWCEYGEEESTFSLSQFHPLEKQLILVDRGVFFQIEEMKACLEYARLDPLSTEDFDNNSEWVEHWNDTYGKIYQYGKEAGIYK
jgi:hypothetical protein